MKDSQSGSPRKISGKNDCEGAANGNTGQKNQAAGDGKKQTKLTKKERRKAAAESGLPGIKKPLSAYMLYNNYRRPVLRSEYPSK